ncbi:MAG: alpha/beta hydrolase [Lachnospiraceae bacterium]|nr:alpha/beta hydrolase [Lachnospiraceae bacterium]
MQLNKLAIILPGIGYHKDKPLLYYAAKLAKHSGFEIINIEYYDLPGNIKGDAIKMQDAAEIAYRQTEEQLSNVDLGKYEKILFIGKSIGTVVVSRFVSEHEINADQIWYTPLEATFDFPKERVIAFIGDADPWSDVNKVKDLAEKMRIPLYSYPDGNHSLETGDVIKDIGYLKDIMYRSKEYFN